MPEVMPMETNNAPSRLMRLRRLTHLHEARAHLTDAEFLQRYATKHRDTLLSEREAIIAEYVAFMGDEVFVALLKRSHPQLLACATWRMRALALAEQLDVEPPPPPPAPAPEPSPPEPPPRRPPSTPEERQAGFARYRARTLERIGVAAEDFEAKARLNLELLRQFREDLEAQGFDLDDIDRECQHYRDWLTQVSQGENEEKHNAAFKKF
jgi:hypothetical protein